MNEVPNKQLFSCLFFFFHIRKWFEANDWIINWFYGPNLVASNELFMNALTPITNSAELMIKCNLQKYIFTFKLCSLHPWIATTNNISLNSRNSFKTLWNKNLVKVDIVHLETVDCWFEILFCVHIHFRIIMTLAALWSFSKRVSIERLSGATQWHNAYIV